MSTNTKPKEKKPLKLNSNSEAFDVQKVNTLPVKVEETKNKPAEVKTTTNSNTKHNPSRFQTFFEYPDGKGFYIQEGGVKIDFKFDRYLGWYDEFRNYYNKDGKPDIPPSDEDDDLSDSSHGDNDKSSKSYDSGEEYYHDPLLDEYDIYGKEEEYSDDDQYDIMGMATKIRMLDSKHDVKIEFDNAPFQYTEKEIQDVFQKVTIKKVFKDQGSGYIICPGVDEALKAIKFHNTQLKAGAKSFDLRLNVDYIDDIIQHDNVRVVANNSTPASSAPTQAPKDNQNKPTVDSQNNKQETNNTNTNSNSNNNNKNNNDVGKQTQNQNNEKEKKQETQSVAKNNNAKQEEAQKPVTEEVKQPATPEPVEDKIILNETQQFNIQVDKGDQVDDIKYKLNLFADLKQNQHYTVKSADLKKGQIILNFNKDFLVSIQKALRGEKVNEPESIVEKPAETQVEGSSKKEETSDANKKEEDGFQISSDPKQQQNSKNK